MRLLLLFLAYAGLLSVALSRAGYRSRAVPASGTPGNPPTKVLVVGATGGTGRELVAQALERGHVVTALVRNPSRLQIDHPRLTVVQGDVLDAPVVEQAVRGQDAVVSALGHKRFFYPTRILSEGTGNIVRAMEKHGVPRLVCETSLGIGDSAGRMGLSYTFFVIPLVLPLYFWDKARQEQVVARSRIAWVIVRPGVLTNGEKRGRIRQGRGVGSLLSTVRISRADVAAFMLDQLVSDAYLRSAPGVSW